MRIGEGVHFHDMPRDQEVSYQIPTSIQFYMSLCSVGEKGPCCSRGNYNARIKYLITRVTSSWGDLCPLQAGL